MTVAFALGQFEILFEFADLAVDQRPQVPLTVQVVQQLAVLALAPPHHRSQQIETRPLGKGRDRIVDVGQRSAGGRDPAVGTHDKAAHGG